MKKLEIMLCLILIFSMLITSFNNISAQSDKFIYDHSDPASDVVIFNETENGTTAVGGGLIDALDIKWLHSEEDGQGNVVITADLKAKNKFLNRDDTKYVFRILTSPDNSTGYNITYNNGSAIMNYFSDSGNGTKINIIVNVTFDQDKGDEMMVITISIAKYLSNFSYYNMDAYSMMVTHNATYLDYISELPGHPEYVNPDVKETEDLGGDGDGEDDGGSDDSATIVFGIIFVVAIIIVLVIVLIIWLSRKQHKRQQYP